MGDEAPYFPRPSEKSRRNPIVDDKGAYLFQSVFPDSTSRVTLSATDFVWFSIRLITTAFGGEESMKVKIDYDLCMGDRNCNKVCPEVFQYDEDQMISRVLVDEVPKHLEARVRQAADECAPRAIVVEE